MSWECPQSWAKQDSWPPCWHIRSGTVNSALGLTALSLSLPQLETELKSIPLTPVDIQDLELATGYELSGRCRMEKEEDLWGEWSPILSFQTPPSSKDLVAYPSLLEARPFMLLSFVPPSSSLPAPKDVWISGNLCGTQDGQKSLLLWKVSCRDQLHFPAHVRKPPNNNGVNKTEVTVLPS